MIKALFDELATHRRDDHCHYHHSTINQALHFASAFGFRCCYVLVFSNPAAAALIGWLFSMDPRQCGHFFFEPKGYDYVNQATHDHKERAKVGYNLRRKVILISIWALSPVAVYLDSTVFGLFTPAAIP